MRAERQIRIRQDRAIDPFISGRAEEQHREAFYLYNTIQQWSEYPASQPGPFHPNLAACFQHDSAGEFSSKLRDYLWALSSPIDSSWIDRRAGRQTDGQTDRQTREVNNLRHLERMYLTALRPLIEFVGHLDRVQALARASLDLLVQKPLVPPVDQEQSEMR